MRSTHFFAPDGLLLAADAGGKPENSAAILQHGGGQTRFSWGETAAALADNGFYVVSFDLRGHGDSEWSVDTVAVPGISDASWTEIMQRHVHHKPASRFD